MSFYEALEASLLRRGADDLGHCFAGPAPIREVCLAPTEQEATVWLAYITGGAGSIDTLIDAAAEAAGAAGLESSATIMLEAAGPKTARMWRTQGFTELDRSPEEAANVYWETEPGYIPMEARVSWLVAKRRLLS